MKFLRKSQINFRNPKDNSVAIQIDGEVTLDSTNVLLVPKGVTSERPLSPVNGHVRYNTTVNEFEFYQNGAWRKVSYKEPTLITPQNLGNGDSEETYFGPLNSGNTDYPYPELSNPQNIIVLVENVFQLSTTNYTLVDNPYLYVNSFVGFFSATKEISPTQQSLGTGDSVEVYFGPLNSGAIDNPIPQEADAISLYVNDVKQEPDVAYTLYDNPYSVTASVITFTPSTKTIGSNNISVVNFVTAEFRPGQTIVVINSDSNDGTYTIDTVSANAITVVEDLGDIESAESVVNIRSSDHPDGRYAKLLVAPGAVPIKVVYNFAVDFITAGYRPGQVIQVVGSALNNGTYTLTNVSEKVLRVAESLDDEPVGSSITFTVPAKVPGRYVKFDSPVPTGIPVTVIHGFDR